MTGKKNIRISVSDSIYVAILILLLFISFISYQRLTRFQSEVGWVNHTNVVKLRLEQVLSYAKDLETAQRDLIITKDSAFPGASRAVIGGVEETLRQLDSLTADNPVQVQNLKVLGKMIDFKIEALNNSLKLADKPLPELMPYLRDGRRVMDQIQTKVQDMLAVENDLLKKRTEIRDRTATLTPFYILVFSIVAIAILSLAYYRLRIESRLRHMAESSESKIHNFFNQVPAMLAILKGKDYLFEFANPSFREFINDPQPINKPIREVLPELVEQGHLQILNEVYETRGPFIAKEMPVTIKNPAGGSNLSYLNLIYQAFGDAPGEPEGILVFCYDVSEMVDTRKEIEEVEYRTRLAIEAAALGTFDWDLKNQHFISSPRLQEIFGFSAGAHVTHQDLLNRVHPADKILRDHAVAEALQTGSLFYETRVVWGDQSIHWVRVYGKIVASANGEMERMYGTAMDITLQKSALDELKESEARFRLLANSMPQLIWTGDANGVLNYFNEAVYTFSGLDDEALQKNGWAGLIHPDDQKENIIKWRRSVQTGTEFIIELRLRRHDGQYRWMLSRALPQKDAEGKIQIWVGTSTDIDEQKNFMQQLEMMVQQRTEILVETNSQLEKAVLDLERSNAELESFNYIASHDLQEPLRKIIAFSTRISEKDRETLSSFSKDYFERIIGAAMRMQNLIDAFLAYSRMSIRQASLERCDLNSIQADVQADLQERILEKKGIIESDHLPSVKGIPIQLHQLFLNLVGNALKYSRPEEPPLIRVQSRRISGRDLQKDGADASLDYWKIDVADNGIGFDQQYAHKIFDLFQRLHGKSEYSGTGIGLAICKKIVTNHQGFLDASGIPGKGAVFSIFLPVRE